MSRDYYRILDVPNGAPLSEIKRAYRIKAKEYHPDRNSHPRAEEAFVLVNEAYEYLKDPIRRATIDKRRHQDYSEAKRRQQHEEWRRRDQQRARQRAARHADNSFEEFIHSPIYKTAAALNYIYNYVFIGIGLIMIIMPLARNFNMSNAQQEHTSTYTLIGPIVLGTVFLYGIWYFIFKGVSAE